LFKKVVLILRINLVIGRWYESALVGHATERTRQRSRMQRLVTSQTIARRGFLVCLSEVRFTIPVFNTELKAHCGKIRFVLHPSDASWNST